MKTTYFLKSTGVIFSVFILSLWTSCTNPFGKISTVNIKAADLSWDHANYDYGSLNLGFANTATFTLANEGSYAATGCNNIVLSDNINFSLVANNCTNSNMAIGDKCTVNIESHPITDGTKNLTISRLCNGNNDIKQVATQIKATGVSAKLSVSPLLNSFGTVTVGSNSVSQVFTFINSGTAAATFCGLAFVDDPTNFSITADTCGALNLNNGSSCDVSVRSNPTSVGSKSTTLYRSCTIGGTATTTVNQITVTGISPLAPILAWSPTSYSFGNIYAGLNSSNQTFTLSNSGNLAASGCTAPVISDGTNFTILSDTCSSANLNTSSNCNIQVRANPVSVGFKTATVSRNCTVGGTVATTSNAITVNGVAPADWFQEYNILNMGLVNVGANSNLFSYYFRNPNASAFTGCSIPVLSNTTDFSIVSDDCGLSNLSAYSLCTVKVRSNPLSVGNKSSTLSRSCAETNGAIPISLDSIAVASSVTTQISVGALDACALQSNGTIKCWGANWYGVAGNGTVNSSTSVVMSPVLVSGISTATHVSVGGGSACAVLADNTVRCWGYNSNGQLGDGTGTNRSTPVAVTGLSNANWVGVGSNTACAILTDQTVKCWGSNTGDGTANTRPTPVVTLALSGVSKISVGGNVNCALKSDGTVKCWGYNANGQVGDGTQIDRRTPTSVLGITTAIDLAVGGNHGCVILNDNSIKCWGANSLNQIGDGTSTDRTSPVLVSGITDAIQVTSSSSFTCAKLINNSVKCWGDNHLGYLGDKTSVVRTSPVVVDSMTNMQRISSGGEHSCALMNDNSVKCWGFNGYGRLGDGTSHYKTIPTRVVGVSSAVIVSEGQSHTCTLILGGTVKCWGRNDQGQLGDGTGLDSFAPVTVLGINNAVSVASGTEHTCAVLSDTTVKCWGKNTNGQLGNNSVINSNSPVVVTSLTNASKVSGGNAHTCAILNDNTVKCWGNNTYGQMGDNTFVQKLTAVSVSGILNATMITIGQYHSCALLSDTTIKCWGANWYGQLGDNTTNQGSVPVVVGGVTSVVDVNAGGTNTCWVISAGSVYCLGYNYGVFKANLSTNITNATKVSVGFYSQVCVMISDGTVKCGGNYNNYYGELGNGLIRYANQSYIIDTALNQSDTISMGIGPYRQHRCVINSSNQVMCNGNNVYSTLGYDEFRLHTVSGL